MALEYIITLKAGIGATPEEAERSLNLAAENALHLDATETAEEAARKTREYIDSGAHAIYVYNGADTGSCAGSDVDLAALTGEVEDSFARLSTVKDEYGEDCTAYRTLKEEIDSHCVDSTTGALTPFGYLILKREELSLDDGLAHMQRFFVLIDGSGMKFWNAKAGYNDVTRHLNAYGRALVEGTRGYIRGDGVKSMTPRDFVVNASVLRPHGSGGDEFLVELCCPQENIVSIVERLFIEAYRRQKGLYG